MADPPYYTSTPPNDNAQTFESREQETTKHALTNGWYRGHNLTQLELVQNGGLSGGVQSHHQNSHLLLDSEEVFKKTGESSHLVDLAVRWLVITELLRHK